jgi:Arc/MetJ-type ribon-helix-helix transcriptional regulator
MARPGKVPLRKLTVTLPESLYKDVEAIVLTGKRWISEVDFIRQAVSDQVDRWKAAGHQLPAGPSPGSFVEGVSRDRAGRERKPAP